MARDGRKWWIGTGADVYWIASATLVDKTIAAAIPPIFEAYATFHELFDLAAPIAEHEAASIAEQERAVVEHLVDLSGDQPWWLGYLDTGATDVVFPDAPMVSLYSDWDYVLVQAGPEQALTWRVGHMRSPQYGVLPDLFFPADRSWLVSALWDDTWTCVGGPTELIDRLRLDPRIQARPVRLGEDATPPGREAF